MYSNKIFFTQLPNELILEIMQWLDDISLRKISLASLRTLVLSKFEQSIRFNNKNFRPHQQTLESWMCDTVIHDTVLMNDSVTLEQSIIAIEKISKGIEDFAHDKISNTHENWGKIIYSFAESSNQNDNVSQKWLSNILKHIFDDTNKQVPNLKQLIKVQTLLASLKNSIKMAVKFKKQSLTHPQLNPQHRQEWRQTRANLRREIKEIKNVKQLSQLASETKGYGCVLNFSVMCLILIICVFLAVFIGFSLTNTNIAEYTVSISTAIFFILFYCLCTGWYVTHQTIQEKLETRFYNQQLIALERIRLIGDQQV